MSAGRKLIEIMVYVHVRNLHIKCYCADCCCCLQEKVLGLEQSLSVVVAEFEQEKRQLQHTHREQLEVARY